MKRSGVGVYKRCGRRQFLSFVGKASLTALLLPGFDSHQPTGGARALPDDGLSQLEQDIGAEVAAYAGEVAVAVNDLQTGDSFAIDGDRPQVPGCTINLFVLYSVVDDLQQGLYSVEEVDAIVGAAVGASDPTRAKELVVKTGGGSIATGIAKINEMIQSVGAFNSFYDHAPEFFGLYSVAGQDNYVSANDVNLALGKLYRGELFTPEFTAYAIDKLLDVRPRLNNVLPALLPAERVRVAHKVGFINYLGYSSRNDAGIVFVNKGEREIAYAISFLSQNNVNYYAAAPFGAFLSRMVFDYFDAKY